MSNDAQKRAAMQAYLDALNQDDLEGILALYADEATVEDPVGSEPKVGKAAIREFYAGSVALQPRATLVAPIRCSYADAAAMAFDVAVSLEQGPVVIRVIDVMRFNDEGKFVSMQAFWGASDMAPA